MLTPRLIKKYHLRFWLLTLLFVLVCYQYGQIIHPFEGPDEPEHFAYITHLMQQGRFPDQEADFEGPIRQQVGQAPLYYVTAAAFGKLRGLAAWEGRPAGNPWWPGGGTLDNPTNRNAALMAADQHVLDQNLHQMASAVKWIRLLSLLYGMIALGGIYWAGLALWGEQTWALCAVLLMAFTPQLLQSFTMISNDVGVIAFSTVATAGALHLYQDWRNPHKLFFTGLIMGFAALSKTSGLAIWAIPPLAVSFGFLHDFWFEPQRRRERRDFREFAYLVGALALLIGTAVLVSGWWYVRGWLLYRDPFGTKPHTALGWGLDNVPTSFHEVQTYVRAMWRPLYTDFGWGNLTLPQWGYILPQVVMGLALVGWIKNIVRRRPADGMYAVPTGAIFLLIITFLIGVAAMAYWLNEISLVPPRLFFPFYSAALLLLVQGLRALPFARRWIAGAGGGLAIIIIPVTLIPAFGKPPLLATPPTGLDGVQVEFEGARFLGFRVDNYAIHTGATREMTLCWQAPAGAQPYAMRYPFFIKVLGQQGETVAETGSYTGMGNYTLWQPGQAFCDTFDLEITGELAPATAYQIELSLFDQGSGGVFYGAALDGTPRTSGLIGYLAAPSATPARPDDPQQARFSFNGLHLMDYTLTVEDNTLRLDFLWSVSAAPRQALKQFIHVVDGEGKTVVQVDPVPGGERYPMGTWTAGERVTDTVTLVLDNLPAGDYQVMTGLYSEDTLLRLPALDAAGQHLPNEAAALGTITRP